MDVGSTLHKARIERGLFVPELAYRTRIRSEMIVAIEANDFSGCGGDVFARGHVRALAQALGIDPEPLLAEMGATVAPTSVAPEEPENLNVWDLHARAHAPSERRIWLIVAVVAALILAVLGWRALPRPESALSGLDALPSVTPTATDTSSPSASATETASASPSASETASASPTASVTQAPAVVVPAGSLTLDIACTRTAWVRVINAQGTLYVGILQPGERKRLTSNSAVTVRVGNAAGISITVNGTAYERLGASGQIYERTFSPS